MRDLYNHMTYDREKKYSGQRVWEHQGEEGQKCGEGSQTKQDVNENAIRKPATL